MAGESENFSTDTVAVVDDDVKFGFQRPEMYQSSLSGTVASYDRHVFLCYKSREVWPSRVEDSESDLLPKLLAAALKARRSDMRLKPLLTICEGREDIDLLEGDLLIFPDMIKYRGLKESNVDEFVEDVLVNGKPWASGVPEVFSASYVFVCAHNSRDKRCGVCGPILIQKFKEEIDSKSLTNQVCVTACSHVGGHKYAGNVIIFSTNLEGKVSGHWYGYVTPNDVSELLDRQIGNGTFVDRLWRGQMGAALEDDNEVVEKKVPNGTNLNTVETKSQASTSEESKSFVSCCQGVSGFSCCRDGSAEEKQGKEMKDAGCWFRNWGQHEVLTAAAIAGAVAVVAVAYVSYRKSR